MLVSSFVVFIVFRIVGETTLGIKLKDIKFVCIYKADLAEKFVQLKYMLQSIGLFTEGDIRTCYAAARMLKNKILATQWKRRGADINSKIRKYVTKFSDILF